MGDAITLGDALKKFLDKSKIKNSIQSIQIEEHWLKVMGATIANMTDRIEIKNGSLFIYSSVASLKNELVFQKDLILQRINESVGEEIVREVVIH